MPTSTDKTWIVERSDGDRVEVTAKRAAQDSRSTRVTFYASDDDSEVVASFINTQAWYPKPQQA